MKKDLMLLVLFVSVLIIVSNVSAYKLYCLNYGQSLPTAENPRYTCFHDICQVCTTDANNPTHPGYCNGIGFCQTLGSGGGVDAESPAINLISPVDDGVYNSKDVLFDIRLSEPSSLSYTDNVNGRGVIKNLASNVLSYLRKLNFKDGFNDITIFAKDRNGNRAEVNVVFFVDSKNPKIIKTFPAKGFSNGVFSVGFIEDNPENLKFSYGNEEVGFRNTNLNLNNCVINRGKHVCSVVVNLNDYDEQNINYWFDLEDISGKTAKSKVLEVSVDTTNPILLNDDNFWAQGEGINIKNVYFDFEINEDNFEVISYIDNEDINPKEKKLCSRLKENRCTKNISFRNGHHELDISIKDKAGNIITEKIIFHVE